MNELPAAVVFDLDGTLVDSRRDLAAAVNRTRAELGLAPLALEEVVANVGEGACRLVERAIPEVGRGERRDGPGEDLEAVLARFLEHYGRLCLATTLPYPGVPELLSALAGGYRLALLTNKPEGLSRRILDGLGLSRHLAALVGGDSLASRKPRPEGLRWLAGRLGVPVERLLLVGDSAVDAATAGAAGCPFALAEWGFATAEERSAIRADLRLAHPRQLAAALRG